MMAAEHHYVYTGEEDPPEDATHVSVHDSITVIPRELFSGHVNIIECICHDRVRKVEVDAFYHCYSLKRAVMPGIEEVEVCAFIGCEFIEHIECAKLEIIREDAFRGCNFRDIDLPSARIIETLAFDGCDALTDVKFGKSLESIGEGAFCNNTALKRITIPLKSGLFADDDVFVGCENLEQVFLLDEDKATIQETVEALLLDEWKNDMNEEIESINQILPNAYAGVYDYPTDRVEHEGGKTRAIRDWIRRVQQKIVRYKVEHYRLLSLVSAALAHASPNEIVIDSVLSFLELPDHVFEGEGDSRTTTPALDRKLWENIVQIEQGLLEKDTEITVLRSQRPIEEDTEIAVLKAQNDGKGEEIHQLKLRVAQLELQVAEFGEVMTKNDADGLTTKRPRGS